MPPAGCASDFRSEPIRVRHALHRAEDFLVETRPPAARVEFAVGGVKRRVAPAAHIRTLGKKVIVLPRKRPFGSFMNNHALLLGS